LQNLPDLEILELNNNRWNCNYDVLEVMQRAESRREQAPADKPVKCLEGQQYRELWKMAVGKRSCSESKTSELVVTRDREFTTDMAVDLPIMSVGIAGTLKTSPVTTLQQVIGNSVTSEAEPRPAPESEMGGWASLLSWNVNTLMVFVILPITLSVAVFVSLIAVNYIVKRGKDHRTHHDIEKNYQHVAAFSSNVPLLKTQLTADITKKDAGCENRGSYCIGSTGYHVYERID